jgi:hypothetical protein
MALRLGKAEGLAINSSDDQNMLNIQYASAFPKTPQQS